MQEELDPSVVEDMLAGSANAFRQVLKHHIGPVTHYVTRMTRYSYRQGTAEDPVEDLVQETFVRLWEKRQDYDPTRAKLTTWLHRIAHNLCIDHFRRSRSRQKAETESQGTVVIPGDMASDKDSPDKQMTQQTQALRVRQALMALPERQRSAIVMCHYQGLSNREAAEITGVSVDALESLLARARGKLKQTLLGVLETS